MHRRPRRNDSFAPGAARAFTLTELIVVLAVVAITAAMAVPYAASGDSAVVSATRLAASDLQYAQSVAVTTQAPVTVTYSTADRAYTLSNASGTLNHPMTGKPYVVNYPATRGYESVSILSAGFGGAASVTFDATGAPDNAGAVQLRAGAHVYRLNVAAATGNVTVARVGG
jgi:prepilin-type N-terminal cleavage/methylation domain-containing protein